MTSLAGDGRSSPAPSAPAPRQGGRRSIWLTRRALVAHVALAIWIPGCAVAAWWQVGIALGGDALGWVYAVMWPCFAIFGLVFWWFLVHDDPDRLGARGLRRQRQADDPVSPTSTPAESTPAESTPADETEEQRRLARAEREDPELAEYNAYLASLADHDKGWRRT
jgi:hypothetical protein